MITPEEFEMKLHNRLSESSGLVAFLEQSELWVRELMWENECAPQPTEAPTSGEVELGLVAYWLNHPPAALGELGWAITKVADYLGITTQITTEQYECFVGKIESADFVGLDGTLYATIPYASFDVHWLYYILNWFFKDSPPFPKSPQTIAPTPQTGDTLIVAIVGDWGSGNYDGNGAPATAVMKAIMAQKPDAVVHLGDVYYSGTPGDTWDTYYFHSGEEKANLLDLWPKDIPYSFTLNSNHEMCCGGRGYFSAISAAPFERQKGTSYFALKFADWTILGLDTAYNASSDSFYMKGSLNSEQIAWLKGLGLDPGKVIVLSHHNGLVFDGSQQAPAGDTSLGNTLWEQLNNALGGDPAAWYWGHLHNGIAYSYPTPDASASSTYARCVGHGSIPYGDARGGLSGVPNNWTFCAHTPLPGFSPRICNGYVLLTIATDGTVTEQFCDVVSSPTQTAEYGYRS